MFAAAAVGTLGTKASCVWTVQRGIVKAQEHSGTFCKTQSGEMSRENGELQSRIPRENGVIYTS
jgi:hypothetical protein